MLLFDLRKKGCQTPDNFDRSNDFFEGRSRDSALRRNKKLWILSFIAKNTKSDPTKKVVNDIYKLEKICLIHPRHVTYIHLKISLSVCQFKVRRNMQPIYFRVTVDTKIWIEVLVLGGKKHFRKSFAHKFSELNPTRNVLRGRCFLLSRSMDVWASFDLYWKKIKDGFRIAVISRWKYVNR